ncbi:hypothetical protein [Bacillus piscicola]|uniref:hypothetical protein n=1 Tax=Bacillus piscicola TaxID=1632684 RepID=UPI001F09C5AC|nr:hypothetical protein [Bacillus piscicola]
MGNLDCFITDGKKKISIRLERFVVYLQSKVVEAVDEHSQVYYLLFYKNNYLNSFKADSVRRRSFLARALRNGLAFPGSHPLVQAFLPHNRLFQKRSATQLFQKLQSDYTPHETALIITFLDSFLSKKDLFERIQSIYYHYRRNGQIFAGYRILRILVDFTPNHSWVKELSNELGVAKFKKMYQDFSEDLWVSDSLFIEKASFKNRKNPEVFQKLLTHFETEKRPIDGAALIREKMKRNASSGYYDMYQDWMNKHYQNVDQIDILEDLYDLAPHFKPLQQDLLQLYLDSRQLTKAIRLIHHHQLSLPNAQAKTMTKLLEKTDVGKELLQMPELTTYIATLYTDSPDKAELILQKCVNQLMTSHDITYILEWLSTLKEKHIQLPVVNRIEKMKELSDDPDAQMQLGELYYEFSQLEQAIDCFSWEMELDHTNPIPVRWLSKIYYELDKKEESKAYQQLYKDLQRK